MTILVTGSAGFIGSSVVSRLLDRGDKVVGIDNHNDYYDPGLKEARLALYINRENYSHNRCDISNIDDLRRVFETYKPKKVIHLAAQAGVRYSIDHPSEYIKSNVVGFANMLEQCKNHSIEHLVYASSSSVYGANRKLPFSEEQSTNHPISLYAATKKSNELFAHSYSHLFGLSTTGLRFFTVYGPWGRPDMALFKFTKQILAGEAIKIFNNGIHFRDFTFIDDVCNSIMRVLDMPHGSDLKWSPTDPFLSTSLAPWRIYNVGNGRPIQLKDCISALENALGMEAIKEYLPLQAGDLIDTYSDTSRIECEYQLKSETQISEGIGKFVEWYRSFYMNYSLNLK